MVLDAKSLTWSAQNNLDTAKLKAGKVPMYGKWYFPEIPPGVVLINLETGERKVFDTQMVAGEVLWVPEEELRRANLGPFAPGAQEVGAPPPGERVVRAAAHATGVLVPAPEPLLAMSRPPAGVGPPRAPKAPAADPERLVMDQTLPAGVHLPNASIAPFVMAVGFCILGLGVITHPIIFAVGLLWMIAGAIGWVRIGLQELRQTAAHAHDAGEHPHAAQGTP